MRKKCVQSAVIALGLLALSARPAAAQSSNDAADHRAPVLMRVTFRDGSSRAVLVIAQTPFNKAKPQPDAYFQTPTGQIRIWLDSIVSITDITDRDDANEASATVAIDNGKPRRLTFGVFHEKILVQNRDGTQELIDMRKITSLTAIRKVAAVPKAESPNSQVASNQN